MLSRDRRLGFRVPLEIFVNQYVRDKPFRALTCNLSDTGIYLQTVVDRPIGAGEIVAIELELPGINESIWAAGRVQYECKDCYVQGSGVRFTAIPRSYARLIRDYCVETRRTHLSQMLERIRHPELN